MVPSGRNEPCPCGSGKKYKKCCGGGVLRAVPEADEPVKGWTRARRLLKETLAELNSCAANHLMSA